MATLSRAIRKLTGMPAEVLGLKQRGVVAVGQFADINVFDSDALGSDHPTYANDSRTARAG